MKNCETCGVPQEKRPGCLVNCLDIRNNMDRSWRFAGWKPIIEPEKTCGNCGWHGKHWVENKTSMAECNENGFTTSDDEKAGILTNCQWKQIVCETCEGTGEVKNNNGTYSCPTCQKPKEERLMMPVMWYDIENGESKLLDNIGNMLILITFNTIKEFYIISNTSGSLSVLIPKEIKEVRFKELRHAKYKVEELFGLCV